MDEKKLTHKEMLAKIDESLCRVFITSGRGEALTSKESSVVLSVLLNFRNTLAEPITPKDVAIKAMAWGNGN